MFRFRKNKRVLSLIGAAEKMKISHLSNPKFYLILSKTSFLANPQPEGNFPLPFSSAKVPYGALALAQSAIFLFRPVVSAPMAAIFSSIFSHSLGTVTNAVLHFTCLTVGRPART